MIDCRDSGDRRKTGWLCSVWVMVTVEIEMTVRMWMAVEIKTTVRIWVAVEIKITLRIWVTVGIRVSDAIY